MKKYKIYWDEHVYYEDFIEAESADEAMAIWDQWETSELSAVDSEGGELEIEELKECSQYATRLRKR